VLTVLEMVDPVMVDRVDVLAPAMEIAEDRARLVQRIDRALAAPVLSAPATVGQVDDPVLMMEIVDDPVQVIDQEQVAPARTVLEMVDLEAEDPVLMMEIADDPVQVIGLGQVALALTVLEMVDLEADVLWIIPLIVQVGIGQEDPLSVVVLLMTIVRDVMDVLEIGVLTEIVRVETEIQTGDRVLEVVQ
jgi:hypothetical protein